MHLSIRGVSIKKKTAQGALIKESEINSGDVYKLYYIYIYINIYIYIYIYIYV